MMRQQTLPSLYISPIYVNNNTLCKQIQSDRADVVIDTSTCIKWQWDLATVKKHGKRSASLAVSV